MSFLLLPVSLLLSTSYYDRILLRLACSFCYWVVVSKVLVVKKTGARARGGGAYAYRLAVRVFEERLETVTTGQLWETRFECLDPEALESFGNTGHTMISHAFGPHLEAQNELFNHTGWFIGLHELEQRFRSQRSSARIFQARRSLCFSISSKWLCVIVLPSRERE